MTTENDQAKRLLDYLWNKADVEAVVATHDGGKVRELFRADDPLVLEIDDLLAVEPAQGGTDHGG